MTTTYDVRVWTTYKVIGKRGTRYRVRWRVAGGTRSKTFRTAKLAESFRADLLSAARRGEAFDVKSGLPVALMPKESGPTWYEHAQAFIDVKWPDFSPRHRKGTAEGLATITLAMTDAEPPDASAIRAALNRWAFNTAARQRAPYPPEEHTDAIAWITRHSRALSDLQNPDVTRDVLAAIARKLDGTPAAPATTSRKRAALSAAIGYAIECGHLTTNPLTVVKTPRRYTLTEVDSRAVLNPHQARDYLNAVDATAPELTAYFGCIYYAAMRPGEVKNLRVRDLDLPATGWGEAVLSGSYQTPGRRWTDTGGSGEERALKHRPRQATRRVPLVPPLVRLLRHHLDTFATGADGRLFVTRVGPGGHPVTGGYGTPVSDGATARTHRRARAAVLTPEQQATPLARRPYDLRHAAVSTWLAAGVPPTQVAQWAGHSVTVLLTVYAHAIDGQAEAARQRIEKALTA